MSLRVTTAYLIEALMAKEGLDAFPELYRDDLPAGADRVCVRQVESGFDWRSKLRLAECRRGEAVRP